MRHLELHTELLNQNLHVKPGRPDILASLRIGPLKTLERAKQKDPRWLFDLNRATVQFHNPLALTLYYAALRTRFTIVEVRNFHDPDVNRDGRPPCLHLILGWKGTEYKVEVQLMLKAFLEIKKAQHKSYDITRAKTYAELLEDAGFAHIKLMGALHMPGNSHAFQLAEVYGGLAPHL